MMQSDSAPTIPPRLRSAFWWTVRGVLAIAVLYALACTLTWFGQTAPTIATHAPVRAHAGASDPTVAELAWPRYRAALAPIGPCTVKEPEITGILRELGARPGAPNWPQLRDAMPAAVPIVAALREIAALPTLGFPSTGEFGSEDLAFFRCFPPQADPSDSDAVPLLTFRRWHFGLLRQAARLLEADALIAVECGDGSRAASDFEAALGIARHTAQDGHIQSHLVAMYMRVDVCTAIEQAISLRQDAWSDADLARTAEALSPMRDPLRLDVAAHAALLQDCVQRSFGSDPQARPLLRRLAPFIAAAYMEGGAMSMRATPPRSMLFAMGPFILPSLPPRSQVEQSIADAHAEAVQQALLPAAAQRFPASAALRAARTGPSLASRIGYLPVFLGTDDFESAAAATAMARAARDRARVAIAREQYRRAHGVLAETVEQLVPAHLPEVPPDFVEDR